MNNKIKIYIFEKMKRKRCINQTYIKIYIRHINIKQNIKALRYNSNKRYKRQNKTFKDVTLGSGKL